MSEISSFTVNFNIYEEVLNDETTLNLSSQNLEVVPKIDNNLLCMINLQNNKLETLPDDFFPSLPSLMWLDLRDNRLLELPKTIKNHQALTHMLLQNNCLTTLPIELGTLSNLKVLQLTGNPLNYPPKDIINSGVTKLLRYLNDKYIESVFTQSQSDMSEDNTTARENKGVYQCISYNSVIDCDKIKTKDLMIQFCEKDDSDEQYYGKIKGKCPKLAKSRHLSVNSIPSYYQSAKYLKPLYADGKQAKDEKIRQSFFKDVAIKKHKDLLATRDKIIQDRKNIEILKNWRHTYRTKQLFNTNGAYKLEAKDYPYDTNPEYMALLSREDIERDLPDKYRKSLVRRSKPTVARKSNKDVHLAMKIKQLFDNLEAIDLHRGRMTPRTEQRALQHEIHKISEIKQKLMELSVTNMSSVPGD